MDKIKLKKEVAEALESLKSDGFSNYAIIGILYSPRDHLDLREIQVIDSNLGQDKMHPDDLINAMVNGYDIIKEKKPRDKVSDIILRFYGYNASESVLDEIDNIYESAYMH